MFASSADDTVAVVHAGVDDELGGDGYITNLHVTDLHIEGPVPEQTCVFKFLKELDLDGGNLTGTIPEFLTTCFPEVNMHRKRSHSESPSSLSPFAQCQCPYSSAAGIGSTL